MSVSVLRLTSWDESDITRRITEAEKRGYVLKQRGGGISEKSPTPSRKYWAVMNREDVKRDSMFGM